MNGTISSTTVAEKVRKTRVSKACNFCRKRKVKCDGAQPCSNCVHSDNKVCEYPINCRKPRQRKQDHGQSVQRLERRLGNLETLIMRLTSKLDPSNEDRNLLSIDDGSDDSSTSDQSDNEAIDSGVKSEEKSVSLKSDTTPAETAEPGSFKNGTTQPQQPQQPQKVIFMEQYFGMHSLFNIFSQKSIEWMAQLLGPEDSSYVRPLEALAYVFKRCKEPPQTLLYGGPQGGAEQLIRIQKGKPMEDPQLVYELLENYETIFMVGYLCDLKQIRAMFDQLFNPRGSKKRPSVPELLVMNVALLLCISREQDIKRQRHSKSHLSRKARPALDKLSLLDLQRMQDAYTSNALFYYSRVVLFNEGIIAVQGILLLAMYIETCWTTSKTNYIMISVAVRLAQEVGLHRFESFEFLSDDEKQQRRRLWWFCQYYDMELCYRAGRPPLVNYLDVSTFSESDYGSFQYDIPKEFMSCTHWSQMAEEIRAAPDDCIYQCGSHFLMQLTKIRAKSYNVLFSASAEHKSFFTISQTLTGLNQELVDVCNSIPAMVRPLFYDHADFDSRSREIFLKLSDTSRDNLLTLQLTYFIHLMTINRLPFQIDYPDHDQFCSESMIFRELHTKSARTILHLMRKLDRATASPSCVKWLSYYPFAAYLSLIRTCLHRPAHTDTYLDLRLLIDISMNFFSYFKNVEETSGINRFEPLSREAATDGVSRILLRIAVRYFEKVTSYNLRAEVAGLEDHLESVTKTFPDLRNAEDTEVFRFIFGEDRLNWEAQTAKETSSSSGSAPDTFQGKEDSKDIPANYGVFFDSVLNNPFLEPSYSPMNNLPNFFFDNNLG
ncbi:Halotolerance protein 9 [Meyerozyma sp. JA9]|nr:Halotolerance protein 9 [Meyerozyma sp. JA9]